MNDTRSAERIRSDLLARLSEAWDWNDETARWFLRETDALIAAAEARALPTVEALAGWCAEHENHHVKPMTDDDGRPFLACFTCDPDNDFLILAATPAPEGATQVLEPATSSALPTVEEAQRVNSMTVGGQVGVGPDGPIFREARALPTVDALADAVRPAINGMLSTGWLMDSLSSPEGWDGKPNSHQWLYDAIVAAGRALAATPAPVGTVTVTETAYATGGNADAALWPSPALPTVEALASISDEVLCDPVLLRRLVGGLRLVARAALAATPAPAPEADR